MFAALFQGGERLAVGYAPQLPQLSVQGKHLVDPKGKAVLLKGVNLGNWFVIEPWMLALKDENGFRDQLQLEEILQERFGEAEKERLMDVFRSHWITERDFPIIRSFGMNVVRLPMNYRMFEDDRKPFRLKPNAFRWIDHAVSLAEKHGLYTILDMHGVQGGQSVYDHTGHSGQNKLWESENHQKRLAWLWGEFAKRYRARHAVVAYDIFNEPYGGTHEGQKAVVERALREIRKYDPRKLVYIHGHYDGFDHYGDPKVNGWDKVGFQLHYYPGLFGNGNPTVATHAKHLASLAGTAAKIDRLNVPFLVGEMNVVFREAGGPSMMRRTFDAHAGYGWATTMWSYRASSTDGGHGDTSWGMVTNAKPARQINFKTASKDEIERYFRGFSTDELEVFATLKTFLTAKNPKLPPLPVIPKPRTSVTFRDTLQGWQVTDIGGAIPGGLRIVGEGFELFGGGNDIWGGQDQTRFLYREVSGDFSAEVELTSMEDIEQYAKAGLMVRASLDPKAPTVLLSTFSGGDVQMAVREKEGAQMEGSEGVAAGAVKGLKLRLARRGGEFVASYGRDGTWKELLRRKVDLQDRVLVGVVALSHDNSELIKIGYRGLTVTP